MNCLSLFFYRFARVKFNHCGGIGRRKYKFTRMQQSTVGGHARVETTCRKSGFSWRTLYSNCEEKDRMQGANPCQ